MKMLVRATALAALSVSFAVAASAAESPRDAAVHRVETAYAGVSTLGPESPLIDRMLSAPKSANPSVTAEEWNKLKPEVAAALNEAAAVGVLLGGAVRTASSSLTDDELERLGRLLGDPVYRKFLAAMSTPAVQQQLLQSASVNSMRMGEAVNRVLLSHGLNVPH